MDLNRILRNTRDAGIAQIVANPYVGAGGLVALAVLTGWCVSDYQGWMGLGPGGLPSTLRGWLALRYYTMRYANSDTQSTECYDRPHGLGLSEADEKRYSTNYVTELPTRRTARPTIAKWIIPQRQLDLKPESDALNKCNHQVRELAAKNPNTTKLLPSGLEGGHALALFCSDKTLMPTLSGRSIGEIAHFHPLDCSAHVMLSYADAKEVIEKGWGERHQLSGTVLPLGYTLLYAPIDQEEMDFVMSIIGAGVTFMTGQE